MPNLFDRFWSKVQITSNCWIWTGARGRRGYGNIIVDGKMQLAHRTSWFIHHGKWPSSSCLHTCDNPSCVNPNHLFEGTNSDNMQDCINKGRKWVGVGQSNPTSKLTREDVLAIRYLYSHGAELKDIANKYGVCFQNISLIVNNKRWQDCV